MYSSDPHINHWVLTTVVVGIDGNMKGVSWGDLVKGNKFSHGLLTFSQLAFGGLISTVTIPYLSRVTGLGAMLNSSYF